MRTLEIMIEENASGVVRPVEVAADAPVSALLPAMVRELGLPEVDFAGNPLRYVLVDPLQGRVFTPESTLSTAGVVTGATLRLEVLNAQPLPPLIVDAAGPFTPSQSEFHSSMTLADGNSFGLPQNQARPSNRQSPVPGLQAPARRHTFTRRAFLLSGSVVLGAIGAGVGYAAYHSILNMNPDTMTLSTTGPTHPQKTQTSQPPAKAFPTRAKVHFTFNGHQQPIRSLSWSSDGNLIASGSLDGKLLIWEPVMGNIRMQQDLGASVRALVFSPDSLSLVAGSGTHVIFLRTADAAILANLHRHRGTVNSLSWSRQMPGMVVSGAADKRAIVWDPQNFRPLNVFTRHASVIESVSWSADGQNVASSSQGGAIRVWNSQTAQEIHGFFQDANAAMQAVAFAPMGGQLAVGGDDGIVRIWNGLTCQQGQMEGAMLCQDVPRRFQGHTQAVRTLAWSPDGKLLASGGNDGQLLIWRPDRSQKPLLTLKHNAGVRVLAWAPGGKQVISGSDTTITIWDLM